MESTIVRVTGHFPLLCTLDYDMLSLIQSTSIYISFWVNLAKNYPVIGEERAVIKHARNINTAINTKKNLFGVLK